MYNPTTEAERPACFRLERVKAVHIEAKQVAPLVISMLVDERIAIGTHNFIHSWRIPDVLHDATR